MIDQIKVIALLRILFECQGRKMGEDALFNHVNVHLDDPVQPHILKEQLQFAREKGWVDYSVDEFKVTRWWITESGRVKFSEHNH